MFVCVPFLPLSSIAHTRIADNTPLAKLGEHNKKNVSFLDGTVKDRQRQHKVNVRILFLRTWSGLGRPDFFAPHLATIFWTPLR